MGRVCQVPRPCGHGRISVCTRSPAPPPASAPRVHWDSGTPRWSSATPTSCAGSPCRCCRPVTAPYASCTSATCTSCRVSGARRRGWPTWPVCDPTWWSTPATTSRTPTRSPSPSRRSARSPACPGSSSSGSNDYFAPKPKNPALYLTTRLPSLAGTAVRLPTEDLVKGLLDLGWTDLTNTRATLDIGGSPFEFLGVDDPHLDYDRYALVEGPADPTAALTVGVTHAPYQRVLDAMSRDGAGLLIAGHTHGGQLCVPGFGAIVTNCDLDTGRVKGLSRWWPGAGRVSGAVAAPDDAAWLEVSAGLGTSPYAPVRFACRPEATLLTLVPAEG